MPIPKVKAGEAENDYVGRCMSAIADEYDTNEQAVAICISTYQRGEMSKLSGQEKVNSMIKFAHDFRGIKLADDGNDGPCWENYIQVGTKIVDGREVPDCRGPIEEEMKKIQMEKGISLQDYPWDECIADQTARYGDEETAKKVCGYIKSTYGGGE